MSYQPGDRVHLAGIGTGTVREARSGGRYAVEIKGRLVVAAEADLELATHARRTRRPDPPRAIEAAHVSAAAASLDLHGRTVDEAIPEVEQFINDALVAGHGEVRIIHGRRGGRIRGALHAYLRQLPAVAGFRVDPRNAGVTIVTFT